MTEITLAIWLSTGVIAYGPVSPADCDRHIATAQAAVAAGGYAEYESADERTLIVRLQCGGHDIVLALPPTTGPCDVEPSA